MKNSLITAAIVALMTISMVKAGLSDDLKEALEQNDPQKIAELLKKPGIWKLLGINETYQNYKNILHWSVENNNREILELALGHEGFKEGMLSKGDTTGSLGSTPLGLAIQSNREKLAILLFQKMLENPTSLSILEKSDHTGNTVLHLAVQQKMAALIKALCDAPKQTSGKIVGKSGESGWPVQKLTPYIDINAKNTMRQTALHLAVMQQNKAIVEKLIASDADVASTDTNGNTPLHLAAQQGDVEIVTLLLQHGASPAKENDASKTPVEVATGNAKVFLQTLEAVPRALALLRLRLLGLAHKVATQGA